MGSIGCGTAAGLATFLEAKSRRLDLALYCSYQAMRSGFHTLVEWGYVPVLSRRWVPALLAACLGYLLMLYDTAPDKLHGSVVRSFQRVFNEKSVRARDGSPTKDSF